jgi:drug/metabolite transporter (DMT)-like permease
VLSAAAVQMTFGGVIMLAAGTARGEWAELAFTGRTLAAEIYLTLVGSIVGYSAYIYALRHLPTATVSLYAYANPVIAMVLGALIANEPFGPRVIVASLMVLTGSALVQIKGEKKEDSGTSEQGTRDALSPSPSVPSSLDLRLRGDRLPGAPGTTRRRSPAEPR